jgi:hypothetical protein
LGVAVAELRISDQSPSPGGRRQVQVTWQDGSARRMAVAEFTDVSGDGDDDGDRIRWYLEDYADYPQDPAPAIAQAAEQQLARVGADLFARVFSDPDAADIWAQAWDRLSEVRIEVDADPGAGPGPAWELLRDPRRDAPVALAAGTFVRTHLRAAAHPALPPPAGDHLRVLLVICRPGGRDDVPFRSVASRLIRGGAAQMEGLDLDVLRPPTYARLSKVLHAAHAAGRPYHVVHFDGHGIYLDAAGLNRVSASQEKFRISLVAPVRPGQHGYLEFEDPGSVENMQLADGPTLGRLLTATGVPVLVLNACRSAYAEARQEPGPEPGQAPSDVHARIRAYGSLAAEVADAGVPGVIAMRYNVYVDTAAQFFADLYAHLLAGRSLGQAATSARRALADNPVRQVASVPVELQDWTVPVVYESAPLVLLRPPERPAPVIKLDASAATGSATALPRPPAAGFFGRDETLLALDRAFDIQPVVLLHAFAGAGKSSTAAEFARWYAGTGGLDHPQWPGTVLWSSFEHHQTADRVIGTVGDQLAALLETSGIAWAALTDPAQRRAIVLQVLAQVPAVWVWDNVEPVTGFPAGAPSAWTAAEQDDLAELLRDLAQRTRCKMLLTSRRDERAWLGNLPARVSLPAMPMRESTQLAAELAARQGVRLSAADWRPLLRYAAGNPLTITVVVGQALREGLADRADAEDFVARLRAGEARLEADQDTALGRTRSLAASLSYGFARAFTDAERDRLAVLHLFRDTVDVAALCVMGDARLGESAVPELTGLDREAGIGLLDRAADIGLLFSLGGGSYQIHPALPWYFTELFTGAYGRPADPAADRVARAYALAMGDIGGYYVRQAEAGRLAQVVDAVQAEEANVLHALDLARAWDLRDAAMGCLQVLYTLYQRTGRNSEWARLVAAMTPDVTDPVTDGPLPGREQDWNVITSYRVRLAQAARDWPAAIALLNDSITWNRDRVADALAAPPADLTQVQRAQIRDLSADLNDLGNLLFLQRDPGCLPSYRESLELVQRIGDRATEAQISISLGNAHLRAPRPRDLDQAEHWYRHSLSLLPDSDRHGRALCHGSLGSLAVQRFGDAQAVGQPGPVLLEHLSTALRNYQQSLDLTPADDHETRAITEGHLASVFAQAGDTGEALRRYQRSLKHKEAREDLQGAGLTRHNIAALLGNDGRFADALLYARAALDNFQQAGPSAADRADLARGLIAQLEQDGQR